MDLARAHVNHGIFRFTPLDLCFFSRLQLEPSLRAFDFKRREGHLYIASLHGCVDLASLGKVRAGRRLRGSRLALTVEITRGWLVLAIRDWIRDVESGSGSFATHLHPALLNHLLKLVLKTVNSLQLGLTGVVNITQCGKLIELRLDSFFDLLKYSLHTLAVDKIRDFFRLLLEQRILFSFLLF